MSTVFNQVAVDYDRYRPEYPPEVYDAVEAYGGALADARVLDLAAGTGIATRGLVARGARVVATDLGADMLAILRARSPEAAAVVAVGHRLPIADGALDVVACASAWHWLDVDHKGVEIMRVLRPGGTVALWWGFGGLHGDEEAIAGERAVYEKWEVGSRPLITPEPDFTDPAGDLPARGFADLVVHDLETTREVSVEHHIRHISTHSPVLALRDDLPAFQSDLRELFAGMPSVTERIGCRVFLARNP